jgi:hypothetical protein
MDVQSQEIKSNPLLERIKIPGETVRLPSNGLFYKNGELSDDVRNGEIHLYPLTAMSEILLRSPDKMLNGDALLEVFAQCAPQIKNPMNMLSKDIDYIMTAIRKVTYGDVIDVNYTHNCKDAKSHAYSISLSKILAASKPIDPTQLNVDFSMTMPNYQVVKLQPMRFNNIINIMQSINDQQQDDGLGDQLIRSVAFMIVAVDEITDSDMIIDWLKSIPVAWFNDISKTIEKGSEWGPDFHYTAECVDCGQEVELSVTLNPLTFFM